MFVPKTCPPVLLFELELELVPPDELDPPDDGLGSGLALGVASGLGDGDGLGDGLGLGLGLGSGLGLGDGLGDGLGLGLGLGDGLGDGEGDGDGLGLGEAQTFLTLTSTLSILVESLFPAKLIVVVGLLTEKFIQLVPEFSLSYLTVIIWYPLPAVTIASFRSSLPPLKST